MKIDYENDLKFAGDVISDETGKDFSISEVLETHLEVSSTVVDCF